MAVEGATGELRPIAIGEVGGVIREGRVTREALLPADRTDVWAALTQAEQLAEWLGGDVEIDPTPRGRVLVQGPEGSVDRQGRVIAVNQPYRLVIEWWDGSGDEAPPVTRVEFVLQQDEGGTRLTVSEWPLVQAAPTEALG